MWGIVAADIPAICGIVLALIFLEGLLSADNALVLAVMVRHLPKRDQKRALRYGIWGAFVFRLIAVLLSGQLLKYWWFQVIGGLYLLYLAGKHFLTNEDDIEIKKSSRFGNGLWGTVVAVEFADIAFSIDSIVAAVAMAPDKFGPGWKLILVYIGGILGIVTMRFVAGYFIVLLEKFKGLGEAAYLLVAWIGVKLILSGLHNARSAVWELPEWLFWTVMVLIVTVSILLSPRVPKTEGPDALVSAGKNEEDAAAGSE